MLARYARSPRRIQGHKMILSRGSIMSLIIHFSIRRYKKPARTLSYLMTSSDWSCRNSVKRLTEACRRRLMMNRLLNVSPLTCKIYQMAAVNEKAWFSAMIVRNRIVFLFHLFAIIRKDNKVHKTCIQSKLNMSVLEYFQIKKIFLIIILIWWNQSSRFNK